jgi:hypothetical protein
MKPIYKIRSIIQSKKKGQWIDVYRLDEKIVIGKLTRAVEVFRTEKNNAECYCQYSKYRCSVRLFIPHMHNNGELAYWSDTADIDSYHVNWEVTP